MSQRECCYLVHKYSFFQKWANPGLIFVYFRSFQTHITIFTTNKCEKCPSSIRCRDSNSRPSDFESLPVTTRPGLPPIQKYSYPVILSPPGSVLCSGITRLSILLVPYQIILPQFFEILFQFRDDPDDPFATALLLLSSHCSLKERFLIVIVIALQWRVVSFSTFYEFHWILVLNRFFSWVTCLFRRILKINNIKWHHLNSTWAWILVSCQNRLLSGSATSRNQNLEKYLSISRLKEPLSSQAHGRGRIYVLWPFQFSWFFLKQKTGSTPM